MIQGAMVSSKLLNILFHNASPLAAFQKRETPYKKPKINSIP